MNALLFIVPGLFVCSAGALMLAIIPARIRMERRARSLVAQHPGAEQTSLYFEVTFDMVVEQATRDRCEDRGDAAPGLDLFASHRGNPDLVRATHRSAEGTAANFCALGAAASLARLDETKMRYAISYSAQQVSGLWSWVKDKDHIEKAFDFGGMGARTGVMAVTMVQAGMTGVYDVLDGTHNLFIALSTDPKPQEMVNGLGSHFYVADSAIKKFAVGYPIQAPLDAFLTLRKQYNLTPGNVRSIIVKLPPDTIGIVGDSAMVDVNCAHIIAVALVKGTISYADSNDTALMRDPNILQQRAKVTVTADPALADPAAPRGAIVEVTLTNGQQVSHHTKFPPGTKENPLSTADTNEKARALMAPVLGELRPLITT